MILVELYLDKVCGKNYLDDELLSNTSCGLKKILGEKMTKKKNHLVILTPSHIFGFRIA